MSEFDSHDDFEDLPPSKSAIKREAEHLKKIGERLLTLSDAQLAGFALTDVLLAAIEEGKRLKSREGLRRHKQYIGKLLREFDSEAIEAKLNEMDSAHTLNTRAFHELEDLREQLITGDNKTIGEVIARFPGVDTQKLRQLVRNAKKEQQTQPPGVAHSRKLFRFLRELSEES